MLTNCSNIYGPWQFPEKPIPLYDDGQNVRDWLYVEDHVDALLRWRPWRAHQQAGGGGDLRSARSAAACRRPHARLITPVTARPGHDRRDAIDPTRISSELGWQPRQSFEAGLEASVRCYLDHQDWCAQVHEQGGSWTDIPDDIRHTG